MTVASTSADTVLIRRLDVTARRTDSVESIAEDYEGGILLETLIGRYVLNRDARKVWRLIDGRRSAGQIAAEIAAAEGVPADELLARALRLCDRLHELGVVELAGAGRRT